MKKSTLVLIVGFVIVVIAILIARKVVVGNIQEELDVKRKTMVKTTRILGEFNSVESMFYMNITVIESEENKIEIEADPVLINYIDVKEEKNRIIIEYKNAETSKYSTERYEGGWISFTDKQGVLQKCPKPKVVVYCKKISDILVYESELNMLGTSKSDSLIITACEESLINISPKNKRVKCELNVNSQLNISGNVNNMTCNVNNQSSFNSKKANIDTLNIVSDKESTVEIGKVKHLSKKESELGI